MIVGIMQPYFFPYLGHFDLIHYATRWIVFDTAQYIRHGWVNRNRILHPKEGWQYVIVPLRKHEREIAICDVAVSNEGGWQQRILGQLMHYRKHAPHFRSVYDLVDECLSVPERSLSRFNIRILSRICKLLDIRFEFSYFSELALNLGPVNKPGDWALEIVKSLGASEYVNPPGGAHLFDREDFDKHGIKLTIRQPEPFFYTCRGYTFVPNLSIIDVLMWNDPSSIRQYLDSRSSPGGGDAWSFPTTPPKETQLI